VRKGATEVMFGKLSTTAALFVLLGGGLQAGGGDGAKFAKVSFDDARREAATAQLETSAAMWIWADKYVYTAGEQLTLKWTLKPNNDLYPYTLVAFRQNNQTGRKFYIPGGTETPTDIFGNTSDQGFLIARLPSAEKQVLLGNGGLVGPAVTIPNDQPGMHTLVVQIRDYTGTRVVKAAYFKIGVVTESVDVTGEITADTTWVNTKAYRLTGLVLVKSGATLTIEPGTFVIGLPGTQPARALLITKTGKLMAEGTRNRPIIMTSSLPFGQRKPGDWGGLILLGEAPINVAGGTANIEGLPPSDDTAYGGGNANHNCGTLAYVRVEYAGAILGFANEVNSFTWGGCGKQTVAHHLNAVYGLDDSFEWFGGTMDAKYLAGNYGRDDYIDSQLGYTGRIQHVVALVNSDNANRGIENDNSEFDFQALPKNKPTMYNFTFVGAGAQYTQGADEGTSVGAIWLRRGAAGTYHNMILHTWVSNGIDFRDDATLANLDNGDLSMDGMLMWDNGKASDRPNTVSDQCGGTARPFCTGQRGQAHNFVSRDPMLRRPFEYSDPDFRPMPGSPVYWAGWVQPPDDGFFDQWAHWIGAFGEENWLEEWTNFLQEQDIQ